MTLAVGPEGGWSAGEVATAVAAGFRVVTFGRLTLRADAVAAEVATVKAEVATIKSTLEVHVVEHGD